jgi:hypothetical protein
MNPQSQNITLGSHTLCPNCADDIHKGETPQVSCFINSISRTENRKHWGPEENILGNPKETAIRIPFQIWRGSYNDGVITFRKHQRKP